MTMISVINYLHHLTNNIALTLVEIFRWRMSCLISVLGTCHIKLINQVAAWILTP